MTDDREPILADRELSWLAFNGRVLQEAADPGVPLFDRLAFLAIFSSNLDEFFRVRVASLRTLMRLKKKKARALGLPPRRLLRQIHATVSAQQTRFGEIFGRSLLPELAENGIFLVDQESVSERHHRFLETCIDETVRPLLEPRVLATDGEPVFLEDRQVYLVAEVWPSDDVGLGLRPSYRIVRVPDALSRFVPLPPEGNRREVMFLDDVIRFGLQRLVTDGEVGRAYAVKLSRDADLYLDDEFDGDIVQAIRKSLSKRKTGVPSRFLYDMNAPYALVSFLKDCLGLDEDDLILGGRYHNLHDLHGFPRFGLDHLSYSPEPPLPHPVLGGPDTPAVPADPASPSPPPGSVLDAVSRADQVVHTPYQDYGPVVRFLEEAAADPRVEEVWITVYRVSGESAVLRALLAAAAAGKRVCVFLEVKARFDEEANLRWGDRLEGAGVRTLYSLPKLKVHAKLALVSRRENGRLRHTAYLGTGNFNEKTARIYADHGLFTADPEITADVREVFGYLAGTVEEPRFRRLLVAPFGLREAFYRRIEREADHSLAGRPSGMVLKMNSLEDPDVIERLYEASRAGVPIRLVVRGICRLVPGVAGQSETIQVRSIVDRYLEHARVYLFRNGGDEEYLLGSADWMRRNLSRRVEVAFPVDDPDVQNQLRRILDLQLADNVKARRVDASLSNRRVDAGEPAVRSQEATRQYLQGLLEGAVPPSPAGAARGAKEAE